ncbi:cell separation during budding [Polyrhizophydium stewartii]|uniref:Cell separation during budding n=1 Tax=Polyrhizophydium stewartii TaxID=2732419 RepID=A0ABR4N8R8_9FUNG|nr:cell separation during budding [Polyrhizophydium stewartii]
MSNDNALHQLLTSVSCRDLVDRTQALRSPHPPSFSPPEHPICLDSELTVQEACAALAKHRISSAPIYSSEEGGFIGMLDYKDVVAYVLAVLHKIPHDTVVDSEMEVTDIVKRALTQGHANVPVKLLSNMSLKNPLVVVDAAAPVLDAVEEFVRAKVHRVVVLDKSVDGKPTFLGVLSQSTVAAFVASKFGKLSSARIPGAHWPRGDQTIADLKLVQGEVLSVTPEDTVVEALYRMHENQISSIAIIKKTSDGTEMWGSISMTDIKEVLGRKRGWSQLLQPTKAFFTSLRNTQAIENDGRDAVPSFVVHPSTQVITAIEKMAATHTHRMWVVDNSDGRTRGVVGVLSLSNVMPLLLM